VFNSVDLSLGEFESAQMGKRRDNTRYAAAQVALNLEEAIASLPEFEGAEVLELLRFVPGSRGLFSGALRGRPVVFRVFIGPDAQGDAAKEWAELTRAWAYMQGPDFFVPEPLGYAEGQWFYAMQQVSGALLLRHIARQDPEEQLRLIGRAGEWYAAYIAPTQVSGKARPTRWLNLAEKAMLAQPHPSLARLEVGIYAEAKRLADRLSKGKWHSAICHGDFHLNNLFIRKDVLTGFDLGGAGTPPVAKDIARALVHMARRGVLPSGERRFGVDAGAFARMEAALPEADRALALPFFVAVDALARVEQLDLGEEQLALAEAMEEGLLGDLRLL
jgi:hypothetical protein